MTDIIQPRFTDEVDEVAVKQGIDDARKRYFSAIPGLRIFEGQGPTMQYDPERHAGGNMEPVVLAQFDREGCKHLDVEILRILGVEVAVEDLPNVKGDIHSNSLVTVTIDTNAEPPVLVQRSQVEFEGRSIDVYGIGREVTGLVTYSAIALNKKAYDRVTN